jgi:hypothetical protein
MDIVTYILQDLVNDWILGDKGASVTVSSCR